MDDRLREMLALGEAHRVLKPGRSMATGIRSAHQKLEAGCGTGYYSGISTVAEQAVQLGNGHCHFLIGRCRCLAKAALLCPKLGDSTNVLRIGLDQGL